MTPLRRVAGRRVTTLDGLPAEEREDWAEAFCATGASQCGFCTPGIIVRLRGLRDKVGDRPVAGDEPTVQRALAAHLCRCTGWQTIGEAWEQLGTASGNRRDLEAAARRAELEGGAPQRVGPEIALGAGGFVEDTAPADALVAVPDGSGGWFVADSLGEARAGVGKVQGRRTTLEVGHPVEVPAGEWVATLRTAWVEPAYLETDAAWCRPGGEPASPLANGGAFGAKVDSPVTAAARELADEHGCPVRVVLSREDTVRLGPKRPPVAGGIRSDGSGVLRVAATPGIADAISRAGTDLIVEEVEVTGPPTSTSLRAAGWAEAAVLASAVDDRSGDHVVVRSPGGAVAEAAVTADAIDIRVRCGVPLDEVVLRSYCIGAAHMALGWVTSEGLAVSDEGHPQDLTIRSFGVLRAADMPEVTVAIEPDDGDPVNGSDAVFAAVAAAAWRATAYAPTWPTGPLG